ncbi:MAG: DUF1207 domain-containing protein [Candidatus Eisenbacteria bacterium]
MAFTLMLGILLVPRAARAAVTWLPGEGGFAPLTADPRTPRFGFDLIEADRASGFTGRRFPLARIDGDGPSSTLLAVDGMLWGWFARLPNFNFPLESVDGSFGIALERMAGPWSARLRYGHLSSHLGDGGYDIEARRIAYSRESVALVGSYAPGSGLRAYAGPTFMLHGTPRAPAFQFQVGAEATRARAGRAASPYAAVDLRLKAEVENRVNQSYQAGVRIGREPGRRVRISVGYEAGMSERGQAWQRSEHFLRAGIALGD